MFRVTVQYQTPADPAAFEQRYRDEHVALVRALPGLQRFTLSHPQARTPGTAPYMVAEMWFADADAGQVRTPEWAAARKHAAELGVPYEIFMGEVEEVAG